MQRAAGGQGPMQFRILQPGVILPPGKPDQAAGRHQRGDQQGGRQAGQDRGEAGREEMGNHRRSTGSTSPVASPAGWADVASRPTDVRQRLTYGAPMQAPAAPLPGELGLQRRLEQMSRQIDQLRSRWTSCGRIAPRPRRPPRSRRTTGPWGRKARDLSRPSAAEGRLCLRAP